MLDPSKQFRESEVELSEKRIKVYEAWMGQILDHLIVYASRPVNYAFDAYSIS